VRPFNLHHSITDNKLTALLRNISFVTSKKPYVTFQELQIREEVYTININTTQKRNVHIEHKFYL
jgi:hypothetical protein